MKQSMVDNETLARTADAVIISIGAVKFELDGSDAIGQDGFYRSISIDSNLELGRRIDESTLVWWMQQSPEAQQVFHEPKVTLETALRDFAEWYTPGSKIWSNGASFDIPMLEHAYRQLGIEPPWEFTDSRCVRTYRALPGADKVPRPTPAIAHNALHDAIAQAVYVQQIHQAVFLKHGNKSNVKALA